MRRRFPLSQVAIGVSGQTHEKTADGKSPFVVSREHVERTNHERIFLRIAHPSFDTAQDRLRAFDRLTTQGERQLVPIQENEGVCPIGV
jgi:hypothetical protein